ncbi:MAG: PilT/PilU family type 4a pilus ATPase [Actinobacteria bacterium]|nr:PilT/PilU family type 4a pilus ATPase [Actinomycetota bacterium]
MINELLKYMVEKRASDLHIKVGAPPIIRVDGVLYTTDFEKLSPKDTERFAFEMMPDRNVEEFNETGESDFAYGVPGLGRFRCNVYRQRGSVGLAVRRVLPGSPSFESLGLPPSVSRLADEHRGLLLVTGITGSGKTTTTGAMIQHINSTRRVHIMTIEDPIEILHPDRMAVVNQREVGIDTKDFAQALKRAMRQDPDVIFIGEMRDQETVGAAIQAAETGHLVISTLHTINATETVNRIIDFFPPHQQKQVRISLAGSLKGIVSQRLIGRQDGQGRIPAVEVLVMNGRIYDMIVNEEQTHLIHDVILEGEFYGMQTFDQSLLSLFKNGLVSLEDALTASTNPHDFQIMLRQAGLVSAGSESRPSS